MKLSDIQRSVLHLLVLQGQMPEQASVATWNALVRRGLVTFDADKFCFDPTEAGTRLVQDYLEQQLKG